MIQAEDLVERLAMKHAGDVFVRECKTGRTAGVAHHRLDAWTMPRNWLGYSSGYEVKVTRADFERDEKWPEYLAFCHRFYFVAPRDLIDPEELPPAAGLLVPSTQGYKLAVQKVPEIRRDLVIPRDLLHYVLIARAAIVEPGEQTKQLGDHWQEAKLADALRVARELREEAAPLKAARDIAGGYPLPKVIPEGHVDRLREAAEDLRVALARIDDEQKARAEAEAAA